MKFSANAESEMEQIFIRVAYFTALAILYETAYFTNPDGDLFH